MNTETIKAAVGTIVVVVVAIAAAFGISIDSDVLTNVICSVVMIGVTIYGCWKNHNFTQAAQEAQKVIDEIKAEQKTEKKTEGGN